MAGAREAGPPAGGSTGGRYLGGFAGDYARAPSLAPEAQFAGRAGGFGGPGSAPTDRTVTYPSLDQLFLRRQQGLDGGGGYLEGDEWTPINRPHREIEALQIMLLQAGLLDPDDEISPGKYDDTTRSAYRKLLIRANAMGVDDGTALDDLRTNPLNVNAGKKRGAGAALPKQILTNPTDIKRVFRAAVEDTLGTSRVPDDKLNRFVSAYQEMERQAQVAAQAKTGGVVVDAPDLSSFAMEQARELDPIKADARKFLTVFNAADAWSRGETDG